MGLLIFQEKSHNYFKEAPFLAGYGFRSSMWQLIFLLVRIPIQIRKSYILLTFEIIFDNNTMVKLYEYIT